MFIHLPQSKVIRSFYLYYSHPDDIDLFPGGLAETPIPGSRMGPTFACINARQFQELKVGDRFWYENDFPGIGFTVGKSRRH